MIDTENLQMIPVGWYWTTIDSICRITSGFAFKCKDFFEEGIPAIKISNVSYGEFLWKEQEFLPVEFIEEYQDFLVSPKDILLALTRPITNNTVKVCKYPFDAPKGLLNQRVAIIKPYKGFIVEQFLFYYFQSNLFKLQIENNVSETLQPNLSPKKLSYFLFSLPPLPEQRAIVSKIELLFSELDNGIANLKLAQAQLKVYRQAVLKKAFEGELTKKWREQQTDLPDAGDLLEQIRKEKEEAAKISGKKQKSVLRLTEDELIELPRTPDGWRWTKIGQVSKVGTGVTPLKKRRDFYESGTIPWVTSGALNESYVNLASDYVTEIALKETSLKIYPKHTLLVALYGEGKTRGKCSELLIEATTNQAIAAIVQEGTEEEIRPYLKWFLMKNYNEIRMKSSGGVQPNLNLGIIENTGFPICSLPEQHAIVQEIETRLSVCDKIEQDIKENLEKAEALRQSILKKAFEGKLLNERELAEVRGAEDWESAEVLLERIRAEKTASGKKGRS